MICGLMVSCRCQTLLSDFDCDRVCNSHVVHHKACPALLNVCGIPAQGQLAGLLSNGSASQGMGPPSMLPPHHGGPLHPQDWMAQPHMNGQMNGLMPSPQSGPHPNMQDSRYVTFLTHSDASPCHASCFVSAIRHVMARPI